MRTWQKATPTSTASTRAVLSPMGEGLCGLRVASTPMRPPLSRGTCTLALRPVRSADRYLARSGGGEVETSARVEPFNRLPERWSKAATYVGSARAL